MGYVNANFQIYPDPDQDSERKSALAPKSGVPKRQISNFAVRVFFVILMLIGLFFFLLPDMIPRGIF